MDRRQENLSSLPLLVFSPRVLAFIAGAPEELCGRLVPCACLYEPPVGAAVVAFRAFFLGCWQPVRSVVLHNYNITFGAFRGHFHVYLPRGLTAAAPAFHLFAGRHQYAAAFAEFHNERHLNNKEY